MTRVHRSASTGRFVAPAYAVRHPKTTVSPDDRLRRSRRPAEGTCGRRACRFRPWHGLKPVRRRGCDG